MGTEHEERCVVDLDLPRERGRAHAVHRGDPLDELSAFDAREIAALPALVQGLNDSEPLIRGACAWALGQLGSAEAEQALQARLATETDAIVREEIEHVLQTRDLNP